MSLEKYLINSIGEDLDDLVNVNKIDSVLMISTDKGAISVEECEANEWEIQYFSFDLNLKVNDEILKDLKKDYCIKAGEGKYVRTTYFKKVLPYEKALEVSLYLLAKILPTQNIQNKSLN